MTLKPVGPPRQIKSVQKGAKRECICFRIYTVQSVEGVILEIFMSSYVLPSRVFPSSEVLGIVPEYSQDRSIYEDGWP